jgi:hypothetical protein
MKLPEAIVKEKFSDYLKGNEVEATVVKTGAALYTGEHVLVYKDSIASTADVTVPKQEQSHYIGIEGTITQLGYRSQDQLNGQQTQLVKVKKI